MATINLGNIKFKWQGAYNGATAYTVDDVVSYNGSSYICIANSTGNLPTDTSYFEQMSSAGTNGTNGTDLTTTLTTQGDLVYRDGSGLARLGAGTAGQVLQTGGAGANPSWGTVSSDFVKLADANGTVGSSVDFTSVFNATYDVYKIYSAGIFDSGGTGGGGISFRFKNGSTVQLGNNYTFQQAYTNISSGGAGAVGPNNSWNTNSIFISWDGGGSSRFCSSFEVTIFNPNNTTHAKQILMQSGGFDGSSYYNGVVGGSGWLDDTSTAYDGCQFFSNGAKAGMTWTKLELYGLKA
jgi:hypothetical protein